MASWISTARDSTPQSSCNNRDGTFSDVTAAAGVSDRDGWSVSASFVDIDRDGWLDLYVGNYLIGPRSRATPTACR